MTINHKIWNFPALKIESQLFHVPGSYFDGGLTSGGARIMSPEPGGRSVLEMRPAYQVCEWENPNSSWIMSKINGAIFKVQMIRTPQLIKLPTDVIYPSVKDGVDWDNNSPWNNGQEWQKDNFAEIVTSSLEGSVFVSVETEPFGEVIKHGHVFGIGNYAYIVDDIEYDGSVANITVSPPLRTNVTTDDTMLFVPYFLGVIANGPEIRNSYDAGNIGGIQLNRIVFNEVVI